MRLIKKFLLKIYHLISFLCLFVLVSFLFTETVSAEQQNGWGDYSDIHSFGQVYLRNCTAWDCSNGSNVSVSETNRTYKYYLNGSNSSSFTFPTFNSMNFGSSAGGILSFTTDQYISDEIYSLSLYLCANNNNFSTDNVTWDLYATGTGSNYTRDYSTGNLKYNTLTGTSLSDLPFGDVRSFGACYQRTWVFETTTNGRYFNVSIVSKTNTTYSGALTPIGYTLTPLGYTGGQLSSSDISSIVQNSGLATANSVRDVQRGVNEIKQEIGTINNTLNDSSVSSSDSAIEDLKDRIPTNSVISDLLLLPIRFLQNFVNALGSSCSQFNLGSLYGTNLFLPCINIESYLGSAIWTTIDLIISGLFVYSLRKKFIQIYENLTNLTNGGNEID